MNRKRESFTTRKESDDQDPLLKRILMKIKNCFKSVLLSILKGVRKFSKFIWDNKLKLITIVTLIIVALYIYFSMKLLDSIVNDIHQVQEETNIIREEIENEREFEQQEKNQIKQEIQNVKNDLQGEIEQVKISKAEKKKQEEEAKKQEAIRLASLQKEQQVQTTSRGSTSSRTQVSGSVAEYQAYAQSRMADYGWTDKDFQNLVTLWNKESGWNPNSHNSSSGAHGIPQALPASKMASYGSDYMTNYKVQINWGLDYIANRYGNPTNAINHFWQKNWY